MHTASTNAMSTVPRTYAVRTSQRPLADLVHAVLAAAREQRTHQRQMFSPSSSMKTVANSAIAAPESTSSAIRVPDSAPDSRPLRLDWIASQASCRYALQRSRRRCRTCRAASADLGEPVGELVAEVGQRARRSAREAASRSREHADQRGPAPGPWRTRASRGRRACTQRTAGTSSADSSIATNSARISSLSRSASSSSARTAAAMTSSAPGPVGGTRTGRGPPGATGAPSRPLASAHRPLGRRPTRRSPRRRALLGGHARA